MGTREPILVESGGGFPFLPLLIMIVIGIIGISVWLTWLYFKSRNKSTGVVNIPAITPPTHNDPDLLSLRHSLTGEWEIYVNGQRYRNLEAVPDEAVRQEVVKGIKTLANFVRKYIQKAPRAAQLRAAQPAPVPTPPAATTVAPPDLAARITSLPKSSGLDAAPPEISSAATISSSRFRLKEPALKRTYAPAQFIHTLNLAQEIGEIVDTLLVQSPTLRHRSIKLRNAASGGIEFTIDGIVYGDIHEIPDTEIQTLIQAAIKEWERRK